MPLVILFIPALRSLRTATYYSGNYARIIAASLQLELRAETKSKKGCVRLNSLPAFSKPSKVIPESVVGSLARGEIYNTSVARSPGISNVGCGVSIDRWKWVHMDG